MKQNNNTVAPINRLVKKVMESQNNVVVTSPWGGASESDRDSALLREQFLAPVLKHVNSGISINVAIRNVLQNVTSEIYTPRYIETAYSLGRKGKLPSRSTIHNWLKKYQESGREGLLNTYTGRVRQDYGWEHLAIQLYNIPSKPAYTSVAIKLREEYGFDSATNSAVSRYLKSLPATLNESSPLRLGKKYHALNRGKYVERSTDNVLVGEIYEGDGHTVDCYVAHPNTGKPYRPELTVWIDIRSKYIVGWYLSEAESSHTTLFALSHALLSNDHVPAWVHIDNGSGFVAKSLSDKSVGFYSRFDISVCRAIAGNSKGKGLVEGWFRPFRDRHDKFFNGGIDYCGADMAPEINRQLSIEIKKGNRQLRPLTEYTESVKRYIDRYNSRPQKSLDNKSPSDLWTTLENVPVEMHDAAVIRPSVIRKARRHRVYLHNRSYEHEVLAHYDRREIEVQYDLHNDDRVWVYDDKHRLICIAHLKNKNPWMPTSRLEEKREKRKEGRIKRLQAAIDNAVDEERSTIDVTQQLNNLDAFTDEELNDDAGNILPASNRTPSIFDTLKLIENDEDS